MSFIKKTWLARIGTGLNRFLQNGTDYVTLQSAPESVTQQGDALSADNMNNLEQRIADAFDALDDEILTDEPSTTDTTHALTNAVATQIHKQTNARLENLEQKAGDYVEVQYRGTDAVPTGKAKYGIVNTIVGKTRAWNQLAQTSSGTVVLRAYGNFSTENTTIEAGHKVFVSVDTDVSNASQASTASTHINVTATDHTNYINTNMPRVGNNACGIFTFTYANSSVQLFQFAISSYDGTQSIVYSNLIIRDLTLIFGAGNEPSTVAEALTALPDLGKYDAYDAGSLVSTEISGVKSVGVNIWDEEWANGIWDEVNTGEFVSLSTRVASKYKIPVSPSTEYYFHHGTTSGKYILFYDINGNYLSSYVRTNSFTTPADCYFITFYFETAYGNSYHNDIQICLNSYADKTTYHPYKTDTLMLPTPFIGKSAGSVSEKLDVATGEVTHPVGSVDLGTLNWTREENSGVYYFMASLTGLINAMTNILNPLYEIDNVAVFNMKNKSIRTVPNGIFIRDESYSDAASFTTAMNGVYLYYELATPDPSTFIDPVPYNFIKGEGGGTVETIQEQSPVIDNCLDVGYLAL